MKARYQTPLPWSWFTQRSSYRRFMVREATSVFLAAYLVYLIVWIYRLGQGPEGLAAAIDSARRPLTVALHILALAAALYHSITWFNLTPKIMPLYIGEDRLPDFWAAILMGYLPWLVVSVILLWGIGSQIGG
ncbi:MAG: fumarate reductase subunit C [Planctomycetes bacterium]|nr:fumarate reductase subunit C [Planctomycetota bacterium]